jgi:uncharacterized surface protein with fasciclin (FAS1) repeats
MDTKKIPANFFRWQFVILFCSLLVLCHSACTKTETIRVKDPGAKSLADVLKNNFSFSLFYSAVKQAGMEQQLATDTLTVLVPDNQALGRAGITSESAFGGWDAGTLKKWVQYHLLKGKLLYEDVPQTVDNEFPSLTGDPLYFSKRVRPTAVELTKRIMHVNGDTINTFNIVAGNGTLHVLQQPLKLPVPTVQSFLEADTSYSLLITAFKKFGLYDQLSQEGPFTVVAPGNALFRALNITADSISRLDTAVYKKLLFGCYVFTPNRIFASDFGDAPGVGNGPNSVGNYYYTPDAILYFDPALVYQAFGVGSPLARYGPGLTAPAARIGLRDFIAGNGIVHQLTTNLVLYPKDMHK